MVEITSLTRGKPECLRAKVHAATHNLSGKGHGRHQPARPPQPVLREASANSRARAPEAATLVADDAASLILGPDAVLEVVAGYEVKLLVGKTVVLREHVIDLVEDGLSRS